jgi:hypothetical protein
MSRDSVLSGQRPSAGFGSTGAERSQTFSSPVIHGGKGHTNPDRKAARLRGIANCGERPEARLPCDAAGQRRPRVDPGRISGGWEFLRGRWLAHMVTGLRAGERVRREIAPIRRTKCRESMKRFGGIRAAGPAAAASVRAQSGLIWPQKARIIPDGTGRCPQSPRDPFSRRVMLRHCHPHDVLQGPSDPGDRRATCQRKEHAVPDPYIRGKCPACAGCVRGSAHWLDRRNGKEAQPASCSPEPARSVRDFHLEERSRHAETGRAGTG